MKRRVIGSIIIIIFLFMVIGIPVISGVIFPNDWEPPGRVVKYVKSNEEERADDVKKEKQQKQEKWYWDFLGGTGMKVANAVYEKMPAELEDKKMAKTMCSEVPKENITPQNVTWGDLKEIRSLTVVSGDKKYDTIRDVRFCTNLLELRIDMDCEEDVTTLSKELKEILQELPNLKVLWLVGSDNAKWTSIDFLENCNQIEDIYTVGCNTTDYSILSTCASLELVYLDDTKITNANDFKGLKNLKSIYIRHTPLSENQKEIEVLEKMYPQVSIYYKVWGEEDE